MTRSQICKNEPSTSQSSVNLAASECATCAAKWHRALHFAAAADPCHGCTPDLVIPRHSCRLQLFIHLGNGQDRVQISNICIASQMAHADCLHMFVCNCNKFASSFLLNTGDLLAGHWLLIQMHGSYLAHILHQLLAAASCHDGPTMTAGCRTLVWLAPADTMMA